MILQLLSFILLIQSNNISYYFHIVIIYYIFHSFKNL